MVIDSRSVIRPPAECEAKGSGCFSPFFFVPFWRTSCSISKMSLVFMAVAVAVTTRFGVFLSFFRLMKSEQKRQTQRK